MNQSASLMPLLWLIQIAALIFFFVMLSRIVGGLERIASALKKAREKRDANG